MSVTEKIGLSTITVEHDGRVRDEDGGYRQTYVATITTPQWQYVDNTLCSGVGERPNVAKAFGSLMSFLTACVESQPDGENATLFPEHVAQWAQERSYELENFQLQYDEELDKQVEDTNIVDLQQRCEAMLHDWHRLNEFLNRTAEQRGWCSEYEERIDSYNSTFRVLRLEHRESARRGSRPDFY